MASLGDQFLPPTNLGHVDEEMVPPGVGVPQFMEAERDSLAWLREGYAQSGSYQPMGVLMTAERRSWKIKTAVQTPVAPSLLAPASSRTIARCLAKGYLVSRGPLRVLSMTPPLTPPFGVVSCTTRLTCNEMEPGRFQRQI
ncbi:hypothetical protein TNCV_4158811 [Trichonephila clavipes]|nr:hypothetical protein TNCV_4158811 [Trichonephila clavipes]